MKLYLSGPITGTGDASIKDWREHVCQTLKGCVDIVDPARATYDTSLAHQASERAPAAMKRFLHGRLVVDRNKHLIRSCDVVLANFLGAERASVGSIGELFWADAFGRPIVLVREKVGNVHDHAMLNAISSATCTTLEEGCEAVLNILGTLVAPSGASHASSAAS